MAEEKEEELVKKGDVVRNRYTVISKLGEGGFGAIFVVKDKVDGVSYAMKTEPAKKGHEVLKMEVAVLRKLQNPRLQIRWLWPRAKVQFLVMKLVGKTSADLKRASKDSKFKLGIGLRVAVQVLNSIEDLHEIGFLHRDIKPSNFAIGREESNKNIVYMLDFGLARQYLQANGKIRPPRDAVGFRGTVRYASIAAHKNKEMGRQDDLWSMLYMVVESIKGQLPWRLAAEKSDALKIKEKTKLDELISGCPQEFGKIYHHLSHLEYFDKPDYELLEKLLKAPLEKLKVKMDDPFEWDMAAVPKAIKADKPPSGQERICKEKRGEHSLNEEEDA